MSYLKFIEAILSLDFDDEGYKRGGFEMKS